MQYTQRKLEAGQAVHEIKKTTEQILDGTNDANAKLDALITGFESMKNKVDLFVQG